MAVLPILWELSNLYDPSKKLKVMDDWKALKESNGATTMPNDVKFIVILDLVYLLWTFGGLFTFQWPVFLFILLLGVIPKRNLALRRADALISLLVLIFIVINAYHLKIDIFQLIIGK